MVWTSTAIALNNVFFACLTPSSAIFLWKPFSFKLTSSAWGSGHCPVCSQPARGSLNHSKFPTATLQPNQQSQPRWCTWVPPSWADKPENRCQIALCHMRIYFSFITFHPKFSSYPEFNSVYAQKWISVFMFLHPSPNTPFSASQNLAKRQHGREERAQALVLILPLTSWVILSKIYAILWIFFSLPGQRRSRRRPRILHLSLLMSH